jgi:hypothetical protein
MSGAVGVYRSALEEVADQGVSLVRGFGAVPMQRLSGVVLLVPNPGDFRNSGQGFGEVVKATCSKRYVLAGLGVNGQHA